ncbi:DUF4268 domain-containing protein [uncultured Dokdonia sp.]|uniref:DUF4268 domain-containing protein n=1 Tax=uncultured Dokdonia sp. TaxID=575653 RepID=UPI00262EE54A|nr:DUF4268 domain-containing protein [uncultured Dokdonia sp.]
MFSKEQSKEIRQQFWIFFGKRYPRKWLLYNTGIKDFALKFDFDTKRAMVAIESAANDEIDRTYYFDKLISLKKIVLKDVSSELIFDEHYLLPSGKIVSRCYVSLENVSIHNKTTWPEVFEFFNTYMNKLENFFLEYKEYITS